MSHLYKCNEWEDGIGRWHCGDVENLAGGSNNWWLPCRLLGMAPADFVLMLKETFNASHISYNLKKNVLLYSWDKQEDERKYKNWINSMSRKANFII